MVKLYTLNIFYNFINYIWIILKVETSIKKLTTVGSILYLNTTMLNSIICVDSSVHYVKVYCCNAYCKGMQIYLSNV